MKRVGVILLLLLLGCGGWFLLMPAKIWRGYTCLMDAKTVEQDPQFGLISADPTLVDLRPRIQLKTSRTAVGGEHNLAMGNDL